ncbi:hydrogenase 4 subunit F [Berryella wangjianweii]|uniref:Hydrogenase 4 subunit F n=1 Tax=Berryella wangjianweii TaxID=2734634 RepID=A0A6M8J1C0_9ACTN|nr:hydrogenase 4 subunit F [Berryella wangjianweii]QKF07407.1 hydrogenase 4 subunit F [Berryella wangjianweii]
MDYSSLLLTLIAAPLAAALLMAVLPAKSVSARVFEAVHALSILSVLALSLYVVCQVFLAGGVYFEGGTGLVGTASVDALGGWLHLDALGGVFVALIGVIGCLTGMYSIPYVRHDIQIGHMTPGRVKQYYVFFSLFIFTMLLVAASNNIILMWVAIEATTLATVFLVGAYDAKLSIEAAWKYVIVCTAGVAFGLYSTVLIYANAADVMADPHQAIFWTSVLPYTGSLDGMLVRVAFVFAAIGFGTKAGLFPMHTWLPDAHSEAPSPVSGLLSGVLLKCAMLIVIRFYILAIGAIGPEFPQLVMLILGIASVFMAGLAVFSQDDLKRKLAYHSCENVGIVALFLGFGGPLGIAAALLHCITHGFTKALLFCISGNVLMKYGTRDLNKISGILRTMPATAVLMSIGFFALAGFPPFAMFVSEITGIIAGVQGGHWVIVVIFVIALTIVVSACAHVITQAVFGKAPEGMEKGDVSPFALAPQVVLVALILWFGVAMPAPVLSGIEQATAIVMQTNEAVLHNAPLVGSLFDHADAGAQAPASLNRSL